jgi:hypothetical protein
MDPTVLAGFLLVAGELPPPWGRTSLIVWRGVINCPHSFFFSFCSLSDLFHL